MVTATDKQQKETADPGAMCVDHCGFYYQGRAKPHKAYDNKGFLHSRGARHIRIMCEYLETQQRLRNEDVLFSILFFGSARGLSTEQWQKNVDDAKKLMSSGDEERGKAKLDKLEKLKWMCTYYDKTRELARLITEWSFTPEGRDILRHLAKCVPSPVTMEGEDPHSGADRDFFTKHESPLVICTGGAGGMMEAANRGTADVPKGRSMGMAISLPFESGVNTYVTDNLAFEFHYFFTRKFWMVYIALGLVVTPGGVGTLDEMFEFLTLKQTQKIKKNIPVILLGKDFWKKAIDFDHLVNHGVMDKDDVKDILYTDDPKEAFDFMVEGLKASNMYQEDNRFKLKQEKFKSETTKKD